MNEFSSIDDFKRHLQKLSIRLLILSKVTHSSEPYKCNIGTNQGFPRNNRRKNIKLMPYAPLYTPLHVQFICIVYMYSLYVQFIRTVYTYSSYVQSFHLASARTPRMAQENGAMTRVSFKNATSAEKDVVNRSKKRASQESNTGK